MSNEPEPQVIGEPEPEAEHEPQHAAPQEGDDRGGAESAGEHPDEPDVPMQPAPSGEE